jgi:hypothetical protein
VNTIGIELKKETYRHIGRKPLVKFPELILISKLEK